MKTKKQLLLVNALLVLFTMFASRNANAQQPYFNQGWVQVYSPNFKICNGEVAQLGNFSIQNSSSTDTTIIDYIKIAIVDTSSTIDSFYVVENGNVSKALSSDTIFTINRLMTPSTYLNFDLFSKIKNRAKENQNFQIQIQKIFWHKKNDSILHYISSSMSSYMTIQDCSPVPLIGAYTKDLKDTVCKNDQIWCNANTINLWGKTASVEWKVNDSIITLPSYYHLPIYWWYYQNGFNIPLTFPTTKVVLKMTDDLGRVGYDSILLHVLPNPTIRMTATSKYICTGSSVTMELKDTAGVSGWAWDWTKDPIKKDTLRFPITTPGQHGCTISSTNGCYADTSITFYPAEAPTKPNIVQNDWVLSSSVQADSTAWKYGTTTPPTTLKALNKSFVDGSIPGYYQIESYSKYGCVAKSDIGHYNGWTAPDSMPHVKLIVSSPRVGINTCDKDSVVAMRQTKATKAPLKNERWYLNGNLINFLPSQLYDGMTYKIPLNSSSVKLLVEVTDTLNHISKDSVTLNVLGSPNTKFILSSNNFCKGNSVIATGDTSDGKTLIWDYSMYNQVIKTFNVSGVHSLRTTSISGCTKDTLFEIQENPIPEKPVIAAWDSIMICSDADSVVWRRNNIVIQSSNKTELNSKISGIYTAEVFNKGGCSKKSDPFTFTYTVPTIPVDSSSIKITTTDPMTFGHFCKGDFHPNLNMVGLNTNNIQGSTWSVNGIVVYNCTNTSISSIVPNFIKLNEGTKTVNARVQMKNGKILTDSITLDVLFTANSKLFVTGSSCQDSVKHFSVNFIDGTSSMIWYNKSTSTNIDVLVDKVKDVHATITTLHGCVTYTDTITVEPITVPQPSLTAIKCDIYADVNTSQGGYYRWYKNYNLIDTTLDNHFKVSAPGYYQAQFKSASSGCVSKFTSVFADCSTTGIDEINSDGVKVYPNPFNDKITIESKIGSKFVFIDINGRIIYEDFTKSQHEEFTIDAPPGIYIIEITNGEKISHQKLVKE